jgi:pimeloyl-ACP methyl ester carboxylesterase
MELNLHKLCVMNDVDADGARPFEIHTDAGVIHARYHEAGCGDSAVIWMFGSGGGLGGPAGGMYIRLAKQLVEHNICSLRVDYRQPGDLVSSVLDILVAVHVLDSIGCSRTVVVGHSFGGAVAICSGAANREVLGVAALSSDSANTDSVTELAGRPLLLIHGTRDEILPHSCSEQIFRMASEPKEIRLYDCKHGLDECSGEIDADLIAWIRRTLPAQPEAPSAAA